MWSELLLERSFFWLFPQAALKSLDFDQYIEQVEGEVCLENEGEVSSHLLISLDVPLLLFSNEGADNMWVGSIAKGRSANLYTFIRGQASRFSVRVKGPAAVLRIPRAVIDALFVNHPDIKNYYLKTTEDVSFRHLASELTSLDVSNSFIVRVIEQLKRVQVFHNDKIIEVGRVPDGPIFLSAGAFVLRHRSPVQIPWNMPLRVWVGWAESASGTFPRVSIHALRNSEYLQLSRPAVNQLKLDFPEDFEILESWVVGGLLPQIRQDESDLTEVKGDDLEKLFKSADEKARHTSSFPFVSQNAKMDCGPACMAMISKYFRKDLSVQFWRSKLSTDRSGTSLYDLAETAEKFGFVTQCLAFSDIRDLEDYMFPFVALKKSHYFVVYKVDSKFMTIGDPARGLLKVNLETDVDYLEEEQCGMFLKPTAQFEAVSENRSTWKHYLHLFYTVKKDLFLALCCGMMSVLLSTVIPVVTQIIVDDVIRNQNFKLLTFLLSVATGMTALYVYLIWAKFHYFHSLAARFNFQATSAFIQKMFSLPYNFFALRHVGDFTQRVGELSQLRAFLTGTLFDVVMNITMFIFYTAILMMISPLIATVSLALALVMLVIPAIFSRHMFGLYSQLADLRAGQSSRIADLVTGIATIKSNRAEFACKTRFNGELGHLVEFENKFYKSASKISAISGGVFQFASLIIMALGAYLATQGELTAGKVIFVMLMATRLFNPAYALSKEWDRIIQLKSVMERLNDIFLTPSEQHAALPVTATTESFKGEIEFREVWFRYGGENADWALRDVSFKISAGERVAIVGASGSGKSTIACLIARIYEPTKGSILIDGRDYREYDIEFLRTQIGFLHQEPTLFAGSVLTNIGLNKLEPDLERARFAAERAVALPVIMSRANGFETLISHGGQGFSKGEKQRIALARLFYGEPHVMILDEATAALDGISEKKIMDVISSEMAGQTVINISHRYSTLVHSQSALILSHGRIMGFGPIEVLKENSLIFQRLFNLVPLPESDDVQTIKQQVVA